MDSDHPLTQPEISLQISRDELRKGFKLWKESTATSPSGRHLGHYKSLVGDDDYADYLITQIELPIQFGFASRRWANALQTMLPKDSGTPKVTRLRVIQLFEADFKFYSPSDLGASPCLARTEI